MLPLIALADTDCRFIQASLEKARSWIRELQRQADPNIRESCEACRKLPVSSKSLLQSWSWRATRQIWRHNARSPNKPLRLWPARCEGQPTFDVFGMTTERFYIGKRSLL